MSRETTHKTTIGCKPNRDRPSVLPEAGALLTHFTLGKLEVQALFSLVTKKRRETHYWEGESNN